MTENVRRVALGLDVGGTRIKGVALDPSTENIVREFAGPSGASEGPAAVRQAIGAAVDFFRSSGLSFTSVGVGCAGSVNGATGIVRSSPNFTNWKNVPLKDWLSQDMDCQVAVDNDANCAVVAEWKLGSARGQRNVVLLTLGTGIGGGLIIDDKLFRGSTGTAGELGHLSIHRDGPWCNCGNRGCFERYCSGTAVRERAGAHSAEEVFARTNEAKFRIIIEEFIENFRLALTSIANLFDPDCILIGGAVSKGVEPYLKEIERWVKSHTFSSIAENLKIQNTTFGNLSGAIGAALIGQGNC